MASSERVLFIFISLILISGCGNDSTSDISASENVKPESSLLPGLYTSDKKVLIKDMAEADVIVRVNGVEITKSDYLARRDLMDKLFRVKKKLPLTGKNKKAQRHLRATEQSIPIELLKRELMKQRADKVGIAYNSQKAKSLFKNTVMRLGCPRETEKTFSKRIGNKSFELLMAYINEDVRAESLLIASSTNDLQSVSEETISKYKAKVERFNVRSKKKNENARKRAMRFREEVLAGADFKAKAMKVAQVSPQYAEVWDSFQLNELEADSPLRRWLETANQGDISQPIDLDDGLAIIKVVSKQKANVPPELGIVYDYTLVRCTFYAYQYAIDQSDDEIKEMLLEERRAAAREELGMKLVSEAVIEFPNGQNFFPPPKKAKE